MSFFSKYFFNSVPINSPASSTSTSSQRQLYPNEQSGGTSSRSNVSRFSSFNLFGSSQNSASSTRANNILNRLYAPIVTDIKYKLTDASSPDAGRGETNFDSNDDKHLAKSQDDFPTKSISSKVVETPTKTLSLDMNLIMEKDSDPEDHSCKEYGKTITKKNSSVRSIRTKNLYNTNSVLINRREFESLLSKKLKEEHFGKESMQSAFYFCPEGITRVPFLNEVIQEDFKKIEVFGKNDEDEHQRSISGTTMTTNLSTASNVETAEYMDVKLPVKRSLRGYFVGTAVNAAKSRNIPVQEDCGPTPANSPKSIKFKKK